MTRDEVLALTDEELRVKAAECLGARWYRSVFGYVVGRYLYNVPEDHPGVEIVSIPADGTEPLCEGAMKYIPDYPHDIAAAGELWSTLLSGGFLLELRSSRKQTTIRVHRSDRETSFVGEIGGEDAAVAATRAFVLAMTQDG